MTETIRPLEILLFGATGTIGQATLKALLDAGHRVTCFLRQGSAISAPTEPRARLRQIKGDVFAPEEALGSARFDAVVSCMASRTGMPRDAWAIDHDAHLAVLEAAKAAGARQFVLLSALCVQQPELPFQHAKLAFEEALIKSGLIYSIVRPTAFFKSLSGQVKRVQKGKPFLLFGDGQRTACKPISDRDLGRFIAMCLTDPTRANQVLPVGGPGPAITPIDQGEALFALLGATPRYRKMPVWVMSGIIAGLSFAGVLSSRARDKAELAKIGRYYATHSMLVWDEADQSYAPDATPESGEDTLFEFYAALLKGEAEVALGDHAVF